MALVGQASGGWTESSSALRLLYVGFRNSIGALTLDSFEQTNPPVVTAAATVTDQVDQQKSGVLSGSVAFTRPLVANGGGDNFVGGPGSAAVATNLVAATTEERLGFTAVGVFINDANGNAYENTPGTASGKGPYVSAQGTFGNQLFETQILNGTGVTDFATGDALTYVTGLRLVASRNGYLMPSHQLGAAGALRSLDVNGANGLTAENFVWPAAYGDSTVIGIVKMPADATMNEIVYDQRI